MSKKPDTASALAGILKAKRGDDNARRAGGGGRAACRSDIPPPPPCPAACPPPAVERRQRRAAGIAPAKSSDKANYSQFSVYLRKDTRKKVGRASGRCRFRARISANWCNRFWSNGLRHVPEYLST